MKTVVVYESIWGNTAAVARAIAEGIGEGTPALTTSEATAEALSGVDLIVAGAPLLGFTLPTESMRTSIEKDAKHKDHPPDVTAPSMRSWLKVLPSGTGFGTGFETKIGWSPGSSGKKIAKSLAASGYSTVIQPEPFIVTGTYGPLQDGELERAKEWGALVARAAQETEIGA